MNVSPNTTGLPGITELETIVGALLTIALIASLAGLVISAIVWASWHCLRRTSRRPSRRRTY